VTDFIVFEVLRMVLSQGEKGVLELKGNAVFSSFSTMRVPCHLFMKLPKPPPLFLNMRGSWELKI
jgi:hypothetical protein